MDMQGRALIRITDARGVELGSLAAGAYLFRSGEGETFTFVVLH